MSENFTVEIISPEKSIIKTEASEVTIPSYEGEIGVLKDHISLITFLRPGVVKIISEDERVFFIEEGTVEFSNNNLLILTSTAKEVSNISRGLLDELIKETEKKIINHQITDKEKYLLYHKLTTLKNISQ